MENRLQFKHNNTLFPDRNEAIEYIKEHVIFNEGHQALYAEPIVVKYGDDEKNPNIILCIGSYGNGENNIDNKYFFIDSAKMESDILALITDVSQNKEEIAILKSDIEKLKTEDGNIESIVNAIQSKLDDEIKRIDNIELNLNDEIIRSTNKDAEHDEKILENSRAIESITIYTEDTDSIIFNRAQNDSGITLTANLKLSEEKGQQLKIINTSGGTHEGLYYNVRLNYTQSTGTISLLVNGETVSTFNLPVEQFLDPDLTRYDAETKQLILAFRKEGETNPKYVYIPIGDLVDTYLAGDGLKLENNKFSIKLNQNASENYIFVDGDGLFIKGINNAINDSIIIETNRAQSAESSLAEKINEEINRAQSAESSLQSNIDTEVLRATGVEDVLKQRLDANVLNINELNNKIQTEVERATGVEAQLSTSLLEVKESLTKESERAQSVEAQIITNYTAADAETLRQSKEYTDSKVTIESERSQSVEKEIKDIIGSEFSTTNTITAQLAKEVSERKDGDASLRIDIDTISGSSATKIALNEEITNRTSKDTELENKINTNNSEISAIKDSLRTYRINRIVPGDTGTTASYELVDDNGSRCGEVINIPLDQILKEAEYDSGSKKLVLTFTVGTGTTKTEIDVADLIDEYVAGNGISIDGNTVSIKRDSSSEGFLSLSDAGLKLSGIQNAIDSGVTVERQRAESAEQVLSSDLEEVKSKLDATATKTELEAEVNRAKAAEYIGSDNTNKTVEIVVTPNAGGGNILTTDIKTAAYEYNIPESGDTHYSLLGKLTDGTLFAINKTNAMKHRLTGDDNDTNLDSVINSLYTDLEEAKDDILSVKEIANSALTIAEQAIQTANNLSQNIGPIVIQYVQEAILKPEVTNQILGLVKDDIISNKVFKQKVSGNTDVELIINEGEDITIGLGDNCVIDAKTYS